VPRFGYEYTQLRLVDLDVSEHAEAEEIMNILRLWFASRGIADAVFDLDRDDEGWFAIINDEAFEREWGEHLN
jgi:hypothetical protein